MGVKKRGGFTLIEAMIAIALLAIFAAIPLSAAGSLHWLSREADYRFALRSARHQLETLRQIPIDRLPPQSVTVGAEGWVQLAQTDLVAGSVKIAGYPALEVDAARGRVRVHAAPGHQVIANYSFFLPDRGEAHTVPSTSPYRVALNNQPALRIVRVEVAEGDKLTPVGYKLNASGELELGAELAGKVVTVDYLGGRIKNEVSGQFLNEQLRPAAHGDFKLMRIHEAYGANSAGEMSLTLLKSGEKP